MSSEKVVILVVSAKFTHIGSQRFPAFAHLGKFANSAPFFKDTFVGVAHQAVATFLRFKAQVVAGLDP